MKQLKNIDCKILFELMKNAKISDRKLAQQLGVSQPTVTRRRARLEREVIDSYSAFPHWGKLGYEIFAVTLLKIPPAVRTMENRAAARAKGTAWLMKHPNILMSAGCRGDAADSLVISVHRSYSDYERFMDDLNLECGEMIDDIKSNLVNLVGDQILKPFYLKYLAEVEQASNTKG